jgi:hypothetical protein
MRIQSFSILIKAVILQLIDFHGCSVTLQPTVLKAVSYGLADFSFDICGVIDGSFWEIKTGLYEQ